MSTGEPADDVSESREAPALLQITSYTTCGSAPAWMQSAIASAAAAMCTPARSWFTIFTFDPWPEASPSRWTLAAIASSTGRHFSKAAGSLDAMIESWHADARAAPPDTGPSMWRSPMARSRSPSRAA